MSRIPFSLPIGDLSAFARSLRGQLATHGGTPSHLELLNMLVRCAGWRNFQHFRSDALDDAPAVPAPLQPSSPAARYENPYAAGEKQPLDAPDEKALRRLKRYFDDEGRMLRWPSKHSQVEPCMWVIWSRLPAAEVLGESAINALLRDMNLFDDHALLRRALIDYGMMSRTPDGREYRRIERRPPASALALIKAAAS